MCWSWEVSAATSVVVALTVITLIVRNKGNDRSHALWTGVFGSMQFVDFGLWTISYMENLASCSLRNHFISKAGFWVIVAEPFASLYAAHFRLKKRPTWTIFFVYFLLCLAAPAIGRFLTNTGCVGRWYCTRYTDAGGLISGVGIDPNGGIKCWRKNWLFGETQEEIPILLRVFYLVTISYPFLISMTPRILGLLHVAILSGTWIIGLLSESHASVWCMANVAQCFLFLVEPYLFPPHKQGSPIKRSKRQQITQDRYRKSDVPKNLDAVIVGSGIGSLATAGLMARAGKKVLVLEQHYRAGGCTHTFDEVGNNLFDSGIHYVGAKDKLDFMLSNIVDFPVRMAPMGSPEDNYTYDEFDLGDGDFIRYRKSPEALLEELVTKFPHEKEGIKRYWSYMQNAGNATDKFALLKILPQALLKSTGLDKWLYKGFIRYAGRTAAEVVAEFIEDKKLRALLSGGQLIDWNLEPDRTSWWVVASMMSYYKDGGFYPEGGSHKMAEAIIPTIEKAGGRVLCRAPVKKILVRSEGKQQVAYGVELEDGSTVEAPVIISNAGAGNTYEKLLAPDVVKSVGLETRVPQVAESHGHITAFVCLDNTYDAFGLRPSNIHSYVDLPAFDYDISKMQRAFYADPFSQKGPLITLTCPSAKDPLYAKDYPGTSNVLLLCEAQWDWFEGSENGNYGNRTEKYKALKEKFTNMFLERLYKYYPACKGHVTHVELGTPLSTAHFIAAPKGGSYGHEWTPAHFDQKLMDDYFHPVTKIKNLYLTGEASFFGGLAGAMASGYITALKIMGFPRFLWTLMATTVLTAPDESPVTPASAAPTKVKAAAANGHANGHANGANGVESKKDA